MTETLATLARGAELGSRYRLLRALGSGGMATVWLATDRVLRRSVAIKIIAEALAADPVWAARFHREVRAVAALSHPNIVRIFDRGSEHGREFLVMEYLPGGTLANVIARERREQPLVGRLEPERLARALLSAVGHTHDAGVLHRDIKPENVLLARDRSPRLTDFGIAQTAEAARLTSTGMVVGSARYLAPEVLAGASATKRSDLYSLGRLLEEVASPAGSPPSLANLVSALTEMDPARRPRSAHEALELLGAAPPGVTERGPVREPAERAPRPRARAARSPARASSHPAHETTAAAPARAQVAPERDLSTPPGGRRQRTARRRAGPTIATVAALAAVVVLLIVVLSGSGAPARGRAPAQAASGATLTQQLSALGARVTFASRP